MISPGDRLVHDAFSESAITLQYHDNLNPKLWNDGKLIKSVELKLLDFAFAWADYAGIHRSEIKDVVLTGGNSNYNYTPQSDIDVHVVVDRNRLGSDRGLVDSHLQDRKQLWTLTHHVKIAGYDVEPYAQDSGETLPKGQGAYSLEKDAWIQTPTWVQRHFDEDPALQRKADFYDALISKMIQRKDSVEKFGALKDKLARMRSDGIARGGEFGLGNLVFKEIRGRGLLDKMNVYIKNTEDEHLSY